MIVEPAKASHEELFSEGGRVLADRERLSLIVNLPGVAFIVLIAPMLSYGRFVLAAAVLRLVAIVFSRSQGVRIRKAIAEGARLEPHVNGFAVSLSFAAVTWASVLWPIARHGLSEPLGALLVVYVGVGVPLIVVLAATMLRLLLAFGGCLMGTLGAMVLADPSSDGAPIILGLMGLFAAVLAGGYGMHHQQREISRTALEKKKLAQALAEANEELADALSHAEFLSMRDPLTGLLNRRAFFENGYNGAQLEREGGQVLAIDLDHFKSVNDRFGHAVGDRVLAATADCMREVQRSFHGEGHCAVRLGGEEFALVLARADRDAAIAAANTLRSLLANVPAEIGAPKAAVSASIGVAAIAPGQNVAEALHAADEALYQAKQAGRDRVIQAAA